MGCKAADEALCWCSGFGKQLGLHRVWILMSHCRLQWGPGWWHLVPAVLEVALPWCVLWCRRPERGDWEVLGPLYPAGRGSATLPWGQGR